MLKITTSNGDTLIHADQQPDAITGTSYDGGRYLVHAGEWGKHKYIRKEGNRYIYPEDMSRKERKRVKKADKQFVQESKNSLEPEPYKTAHKNRDQITSAHQTSTAVYRDDPTNSSYVYRIADGENQAALRKEREFRKKKGSEFTQINSAHQNSTKLSTEKDDIGNYKRLDWRDGEKNRALHEAAKKRHKDTSERVSFETEFNKEFAENERKFNQGKPSGNLKKQMEKTAQRKQAKAILEKGFDKSGEKQRKSAHAGYEEDKKKFPDGGSTEELDRQKSKTKRRKLKNRSHDRNELSGSMKIKKGSKIGTSGPVGSR